MSFTYFHSLYRILTYINVGHIVVYIRPSGKTTERQEENSKCITSES